jgi:V8-like Glu-specific endopeptidase
MTSVAPVQSSTYYLVAGNNPITFGTGTNIDAGGPAVYGGSSVNWSVTNQGSLAGASGGIYLRGSSNAVTNSGTITGSSGSGLYITAGTGTVTNTGKITETGLDGGVWLNNGGSVNNAGSISAGSTSTVVPASPSSFGGYGVGGNGITVTNSGSIFSFFVGVDIENGSALNNESTGTITGRDVGVTSLHGASSVVTNAGSIVADGNLALPSAIYATVPVSSRPTIGTILGGAGIILLQGGTVTNTGSITAGSLGVFMNGTAGTVSNAGTISGTAASVEFNGTGANTLTLKTGSTLDGTAYGSTASGATTGLVLQGTGTASNNFDDFTSLTVTAGGLWVLDGVSAMGTTTVTSGELQIGDASHPSAQLTSNVTVDAGATLDLSAAGSLGTGHITFSGSGGTLAIGGITMPTNVISGFAAGDTIDLQNVPFAASAGATFLEASNVLQIVEGGDTYDLSFNPSQSFSGGFELASDSHGGTDIEPSAEAVSGYSVSASPDPPAASPYDGIVLIRDTIPDQAAGTQTVGTGFIIGPDTILTAAHVLEDAAGEASAVEVVAGSSGADPATYHATSAQVDTSFVSSGPVISSEDSQSDFAVIKVANLPATYGTFNLQANYAGGTVNLTGYPAGSTDQDNDVGTVTKDASFDVLDYGPSNDVVAVSGESGGPLWTFSGTSPTAVGLVSTDAFGVQFTSADITLINELASSPVVTSVSSGTVTAAAGQAYYDVDVSGGGTLDISSGALTSGTVVDTGGVETVLAGGTATNTTLDGGQIDIDGGTSTVTAGSGGGTAAFSQARSKYVLSDANGSQIAFTEASDPTDSATLSGVASLSFAGSGILATYEPAGAASGTLSAELWTTGLGALTQAPTGPALPLPTVSGGVFAAGRGDGSGGDGADMAAAPGGVALLAQMSQSSIPAPAAAPSVVPSVPAEAAALFMARTAA